jgi:hypothetical protein
MLVRVEPGGHLSDVKIVRSSGSANLDSAVADCLLAHGEIETSIEDSRTSTVKWRRLVWTGADSSSLGPRMNTYSQGDGRE